MKPLPPDFSDVLVVGAGAAGLFLAAEAGRRGRSVRVIDHAAKPAEKVRISGGGRCNFTNLHCGPHAFLSENPHFCVSALSRFTAQDFIRRVDAHGIAWHEKTLGQLFCDGRSTAIVNMLVTEAREVRTDIRLGVEPGAARRTPDGFEVETTDGPLACASLVIATGGLSIPKMGASGYAYRVARDFGLAVVTPRPGLAPFTLHGERLAKASELAGVSVRARASLGTASFEEGLLFTHRGLSGPAALQISSYWKEREAVRFDLACGRDAIDELKALRTAQPRLTLANALAGLVPKRLAAWIAAETAGAEMRLADLSNEALKAVGDRLHRWEIAPDGTEGWRTAEVTVGGVSTAELSSRTMEARRVPGLYFIGECVDVTGWLGGYNFQWAWSSAWAAGQAA